MRSGSFPECSEVAQSVEATAATQARGKLRQVTIYAEPVAGGLLGYGLNPGQATIPGPLLEIYEGDTLEIELVNNTDQRLSIHPHGVDYDVQELRRALEPVKGG